MFIFEKAPFASCHASTVVENRPGRLLAAWFGGEKEGARDVKIWGARFDGTTWSKPEVLAEEPGYPCWNPVLFLTRSDTLFFWYKAGPSPDTWSAFLRRSADGGQTWSPVEQYPAGLLGPIRAKPIQRADGTILAGSSVESHRAWTCWVERSSDDGKTWTRHGPIQVPGHPHGIIQPSLLDLGAQVVVLCRSRGLGAIVRAASADGGLTWEPAQTTDQPNPNSGLDALRTAAGDWYLISNPVKQFRFPLHLARSRDEGQTWQTVAKLEEQAGEYSYPALIQSADGKLHVTYTWNRKHIKYLNFDPKAL
jgi:predicted neuraminidase